MLLLCTVDCTVYMKHPDSVVQCLARTLHNQYLGLFSHGCGVDFSPTAFTTLV